MGTRECEHHSSTPFQFEDVEVDNILRICSYTDFDASRYYHEPKFVWYPPEEHKKVGYLQKFARKKNVTRGSSHMENTPLELLYAIFLLLDISSLFRLRQTCRTIRQSMDSMREYKVVTKHGIDAFRALLNSQLAYHVTFQGFLDLMIDSKCNKCGSTAFAVYLPRWTRQCHNCVPEYPTLAKLRSVMKCPRLTEQAPPDTTLLLKLGVIFRKLRIVQGDQFDIVELPPRRQYPQARRDIGEWIYYDELELEERFYEDLKSVRQQTIICPLPKYNPLPWKIEFGLGCFGCDRGLWRWTLRNGRYRPFGYKDSVPGEPCSCIEFNTSIKYPWAINVLGDSRYTTEEFLEHFQWCKMAQKKFLENQRGRRPKLKYGIPPVMPHPVPSLWRSGSDLDYI